VMVCRMHVQNLRGQFEDIGGDFEKKRITNSIQDATNGLFLHFRCTKFWLRFAPDPTWEPYCTPPYCLAVTVGG